MQPLHPVLLNSSAMASTVDPQTLISCWGVQDMVQHVTFCTGFPSVITAVEFWALKLAGFQRGLVYFDLDTSTAFTQSDDKHRAE